MARLVFAVARIIGVKLLLLALLASLLYSTASSYVEASIHGVAFLYREQVRPPEGLRILSVYSGVASTPFTGLLPPGIPERLSRLPGVVEVWGETASPALVDGEALIVRGLPPEAAGRLLRIVEGSPLKPGDCSGALLGVGAARVLHASVGDTVVVDPLFTRVEVPLRIVGIFEGPEPYRSEVIVCQPLAEALRGHEGYTVVRIVYDPTAIEPGRIVEALGLKLQGPSMRALAEQAILLVARGYLKPLTPRSLGAYYTERLGVPRELLLSLALAADILLSLLMAPLAWAIMASRKDSLKAMVEQGLTSYRVKGLMVEASLPAVLAGLALGWAISRLIPGPRILGYSLPSSPGTLLGLVHIAFFTVMYIAGVATGKVEG